jgi:hypothetical protein
VIDMTHLSCSTCSLERFVEEIGTSGWIMLEDAIDPALVTSLNAELEDAYAINRAIQLKNNVAVGADGAVHHLVCQGGGFLELLERNPCARFLDRFFGGPYLLTTYGGVLNLPGNLSYVGRGHRDLRSFSGELRLMAQMLVLLDDFTEANGATYFLDGSHRMADQPSEKEFFERAKRAVGPAGSIVVFNSNLWHAAGANRTGCRRRALTLAFTRPFMKQQLDYPRALGYERDDLSPPLRQVLGYNARVPATLEEWYQPPQNRFYKRDQG